MKLLKEQCDALFIIIMSSVTCNPTKKHETLPSCFIIHAWHLFIYAESMRNIILFRFAAEIKMTFSVKMQVYLPLMYWAKINSPQKWRKIYEKDEKEGIHTHKKGKKIFMLHYYTQLIYKSPFTALFTNFFILPALQGKHKTLLHR